MLVHHSRNSEQKQWDETLVLAFAGMARLLKSHLPLLLTFPAFAEVRHHDHLGTLELDSTIALCRVCMGITSKIIVCSVCLDLVPEHWPCHRPHLGKWLIV